MDWLSDSDSPYRFLAWPKRLFKQTDSRSQAERVRLALEELGTTYIKLGQALATRTDLVPREYITELSKLQDDAPPIDYAFIRQVIEEDLGQPPELIFASFDKEPLAAASIGQVHRGTLSDGTQVVVKVQRPGAKDKVEQDLLVLGDVANFLSANTELGKRYDFVGWLNEFAYSLRHELDYRREGTNAEKFRDNFLDDPDLHVPVIYWQYTSTRVLTMEEVQGVKINDFPGLEQMGVSREFMARKCARVVLTEIFKHGFFHADPHPGNFFVQPDGKIALIDLGMVGRLDQENRDALMRVTLNLSRRDIDGLGDELLVLGIARGPIKRQELRLELTHIVNDYTEGPAESFSLAQLLNDVLSSASKHDILIPSDLLFLAKTIAMCEGIGTMLDPNFNLMSFARTFLEEHYRETRSPGAIKELLKEDYVDVAELAVGLPRRVRRLFGQLQRGEITFTARVHDVDELRKDLHRATNRLSSAVIVAALVVGLSILASSVREAGFGRTMIQIMLAAVIVTGVVFLVQVWRSKHRNM